VTAPKKRAADSRRKGADAERELAKKLTELGFPAERGQQKRGGADSPDVICPALAGFHIEAKITQACKMHSPAMLAQWDAQARRDSEGKSVPLVIHRWSRQTIWWVRVLLPGCPPVWLTLPDFLSNLTLWRRS